MKYTVLASLLASATAFAPSNTASTKSSTSLCESKADLEALAAKCNPVVKYFDPLNIGDGDEATIAWYRHSEIKHGRVAMAAFVGYCVQSNFVFPWAQTMAGDAHPSIDLTPEAQWDAIPFLAKAQILAFVGFLEMWDESGAGGLLPHYTAGRKPGQFPEFKSDGKDSFLHPVLNLYDPFGFRKNLSAEKKERGLVAEINNGRLAMLGIFGFISANKVAGSVPIVASLGAAPGYDGQSFAPFEAHYHWF
ncbi:Fucoxanthin-chlorophyll a-c binding protein [Seminavis robusta]|uniref:Fucoxanthin-chlorophyll a-c binding protein n=1 Tax=Seminavis robusta TaxID=568900 RepID=A0A9N8D757_9STRA|nr:Fucoxanthin-chlorophyll a-c binding protein [Seminavis robusta]|eukprot:Sro25_g016900.1 Fucoxanthin-chlorophyll a-c binding protein (249) ;mRNA; r:64993-65739